MGRRKNWVVNGSMHQFKDVSNHKELLENEVYEVGQNPVSGEIFLRYIKPNFEFPYKIYGHEQSFIDRVVKAYDNVNGNLGVLLTGIKGTGKSVTAKQICNELKKPVLLVTADYEGLVDFVNSLHEPTVIFIDEFEKIFDEKDGSLLTLMDGVFTNEFRHTFVLTTNKMSVNENMIQRPSRIRYIKNYGNLSVDVVMEIVDDLLENKALKKEVVDFIASLELITIDIVKSVIAETNIFNELPEEYKAIFNVKVMQRKFNVKVFNEAKEEFEAYESYASVQPDTFDKNSIDRTLYVDSDNEGKIKAVVGNVITTNQQQYDSTQNKYVMVERKFLIKDEKCRNEHFDSYYGV